MARLMMISGILALMLALSVQAGMASAQDIPGITLVLTKQTPYPAEPGGIVDVEVSLYNNGSSSESVTLEIVPSDPFSLLPGQERVKTFSNIDALNRVTKSYKLKVNESAVSSTYNLEFRLYRVVTPGAYIVKKPQIIVQGSPDFVIKEVKTDPVVLEPGDDAEMRVLLTNEGTGRATSTKLSLTAEAEADTGETLITPILSGGFVYIGTFGPGEDKYATFMLHVNKDATYKTYMSTMTVSYKNEDGESVSSTHEIGIPVKGKPVIQILSAKIDGSDYKVDIENVGTGNAKALQISFIQNGELKDSAIANELKPTKHKTLRFQGFEYGNAMVNISYLDESNDFFTNEIPVSVKMSAYAEEEGSQGASPYAGLLFVLVVGEGFYIWRLRKRLKKK